MEISIDRNIYSDTCISKAVYSLAARYNIHRTLEGSVETLHVTSHSPQTIAADIEYDVLCALHDYKLRQIIEDETHDIRTVLYAKAFADCDDLDAPATPADALEQ